MQRRWRPRRALGIVLGLLASACARYAPAPLSAEQLADRLAARSLDDPGLRAFVARQPGLAWPPARWDLDSLTWVAFYFHPALARTRAEWETARAGVTSARAVPNPVLSVTPERAVPAAGLPPWIAAVRLDWTIETAGKRRLREEQAEHLAAVRERAVASAAWDVRRELRLALAEAAAAERREALLARSVATAADAAHRTEERVEAGAAGEPERALARATWLRLAADSESARGQRRAAELAIAQALGLPSGAIAPIEPDLDAIARAAPPPPPDDADLQRAALWHRPDVLAALDDYAARDTALRLELAKQVPDLHLGPGYQYDQGVDKWSIGVALELPLLDRHEGPIAEAEGRRREAGARLLELEANVIAALERARAEAAATREQLAAAERARAAQEDARLAVRRAFDAGAVGAIVLHTAELDAATAELAEVDAWLAHERAAIALEDAVRIPFDAIAAAGAAPEAAEEAAR